MPEDEQPDPWALQGRERIATLSSYVPQAVLRRLASTTAMPAGPHADPALAALLLIDLTGFTPFVASATRAGAAGIEAVSRSLNTYLGQIIDLIAEHGGDISKFVGDALVPIWLAFDGDIATATARAAACGLAIAAELGQLDVEPGVRLSLKVGLCAGETASIHVGGLDGRWFFLVAGDAVAQLSSLDRHMQTGALVASPQAWALVSDRFVGRPVERGHMRIGASERTPEPIGSPPIALGPGAERLMRGYIPLVCLSRLDAGQADWLAELRTTTVVFVNVRGVSGAAPEGIEHLQAVTLVAQRALTRYDGWLKEITTDDKGTSLVAAFGVPPFTHEDDAARAVEAAIAIGADLRDLGLTTGIGVATGPAFCGPVGNPRRRDFVVLGQHVNLASRLMQAADDDGVLADARTYAGRRGDRSFDRLPAHVLKGLTTPIDVYRVRADEPAATHSPNIVDRIVEQATASRAIEALKTGVGGLVIIEGEPGIGKSRLIDEWVREGAAAGLEMVTGEAHEIEASTPYHAWRAVFERLLGLESITDRATRRETVLTRLGDDPESLRLAPLLSQILSIDVPDNEATGQLTGEVRADNTRDLLVRLLLGQASQVPLMVVLEDAHWLDSASWSLVLQARLEIPSLLLVATRRPAADPAADPAASILDESTILRLEPLSSEDALRLACERTGASQIAEPVAAILERRAEGNPLFIEQLTYAMRDAGRIVLDKGTCRAAPGIDDLEGSIIPDTVQRVIMSRLDQLPPEVAMTLKVASVIGPKFPLRVLQDIYPVPTEAPALVGHLDALTRLDLVAPAPFSPEPAYEFRHVITQEVAYNLMLSTQLRQLHLGLAEWYERTYAADLSPFHAFLAHHWRRAGVPARAVDHLELAGAQALRTFANEEAIGFLEAALSLSTDAGLAIEPSRRARWHLQLGEASVHMSNYREGRGHLELGLRLMGQAAPASGRRQATGLLGELVRQILRRAGLRRGVRSLSDAERTDLVAFCRAYERLAEASYYLSETLLPLYCVIRILNESEASGIPAEIARGFAGTGALFGVVPLPRIAEWYLKRAIGRLDEVDDLTTREIVGIVVAYYYEGAGDWDMARDQLTAVRNVAQRLGDRRRLDDAVENLMELEYLRGSFATAAELADELTAAAAARNDHRFQADGLVGKAYCAWHLGNAPEAVRCLAAARSIGATSTEVTDELKIKLAGVSALIQLGRGERQGAVAAADEAMLLTANQRPTAFGTLLGYLGAAEVHLSVWEAGDPVHDARARAVEALGRLKRYAGVFPIGRPRSALLEGRRHWMQGEHDAAFRSWREALARAMELSMTYEQGLAHREIGRHLEPDDPARAGHLREAAEIFRGLDAAPALASVTEAAEPGFPNA
jgi:class 3 adenylate cyclase/tetratricopeptide (TPR) repeat protein